jgi:AraC family transcriptional regulator
MDWLNSLNEAISYIESRLDDEIDLDRAAQIACCSTFHFQRMFSYIADITLSEYIRRRRMTLAAAELQSGSEKVIDLALKYGYDSPTAFNRAFQSVHGIAPSAARKAGVYLKTYPPISFKITIKGEAEMNYKIVKKEAFRIVGVKEHFSGGIEEAFAKVPLFWQKAHKEGVIPKLCEVLNREPYGILGISTSSSSLDFDYFIAAASDKPIPEGMEELILPETTWAIFECVGPMPAAIQTLQKRIVTEWLPSSGYEYANAPDIELYSEGDQTAADNKCEVWLPVVKK